MVAMGEPEFHPSGRRLNGCMRPNMADDCLVSCVCVTRNRIGMLRRAVSCFLNQTYPARELVVVYEADDPATRHYLAALNHPAIRPVEVGVSPQLALGDLRNISIQSSRGHFVAQWDDDDWYGPTRLADQIEAIRQSGRKGCVLSRWLMYDVLTATAYVSGSRAWEGSIVAERGAMPPYPSLSKGEDSVAITQMIANDSLVALDRPQLYVYTVHGENTWDRSHWERNLRPYSQPLALADQEWLQSLLAL